jgi:hypothetical protein
MRSVARFERDQISEGTREAPAVKRAQGVRLGLLAVNTPVGSTEWPAAFRRQQP